MESSEDEEEEEEEGAGGGSGSELGSDDEGEEGPSGSDSEDDDDQGGAGPRGGAGGPRQHQVVMAADGRMRRRALFGDDALPGAAGAASYGSSSEEEEEDEDEASSSGEEEEGWARQQRGAADASDGEEEDEEGSEEEEEETDDEGLGAAARWKANMLERAAALFRCAGAALRCAALLRERRGCAPAWPGRPQAPAARWQALGALRLRPPPATNRPISRAWPLHSPPPCCSTRGADLHQYIYGARATADVSPRWARSASGLLACPGLLPAQPAQARLPRPASASFHHSRGPAHSTRSPPPLLPGPRRPRPTSCRGCR